MVPGYIFRVIGLLAVVVPAAAEDSPVKETVRIELNTAQPAENRCRLNFVLENKLSTNIGELKLDLVFFNPEGIIHLRTVFEMGPLPAGRTRVRTWPIDTTCAQIGSVLVNDISPCVPDKPDACFEGLQLSSKVPNVRLYK